MGIFTHLFTNIPGLNVTLPSMTAVAQTAASQSYEPSFNVGMAVTIGLCILGAMLFLGIILTFSVVQRRDPPMTSKELELANVPFMQQLAALIVSIDVDTTRFYEFIWGYRAAYGYDSAVFVYVVTGSHLMKMEMLSKYFDEYDFDNKFSSQIAWRGVLMEDENGNVPRFVVSITHYDPTQPYALVAVGDKETVEKFEKFFLDTFQAPTIKKLSIVNGLNRDGSLAISSRVMDENEPKIGRDEFYPFIEGGIKKLAEEFHAADETVLLLIGSWGTGKSTLIRTLILDMACEHFGICNHQMALNSPEIMTWINGFEDRSMIAIEDADKFVEARSEGNEQMSGLLNSAEGIIQTKRKIVISTNLPSVNKVDQALIRAGRTYKTIEFRALTLDEANKARVSIGLDELPADAPRHLSLANALNYHDANNFHTTPKRVAGILPQSHT